MTDAEKAAIAKILADCPDQTIPGADAKPTHTPTPRSTPKTETSTEAPRSQAPKTTAPPKTEAPKTKAPPKDVHYKNCSEARAAGAAPLYRGDPGYRSALDGDGDGIACEK